MRGSQLKMQFSEINSSAEGSLRQSIIINYSFICMQWMGHCADFYINLFAKKWVKIYSLRSPYELSECGMLFFFLKTYYKTWLECVNVLCDSRASLITLKREIAWQKCEEKSTAHFFTFSLVFKFHGENCEKNLLAVCIWNFNLAELDLFSSQADFIIHHL